METYLMISEAAKEVQVESHVLRYWEEELHLPIKRNDQGHRYYTKEDIDTFKQIKTMKERGLQLKAIKMILKDGKLDVIRGDGVSEEDGKAMGGGTLTQGKADLPMEVSGSDGGGGIPFETKEEKARRLQWLLQQMIRETVQENNQELSRDIRESIVKELDYQFRTMEEKEEERDQQLLQRSEEYYRKVDELLKSKTGRKDKKEKNGRKLFGRKGKEASKKAVTS